MILSFIPLYSLSWLITEPIKALEIKTSKLFNFDFANNTTLSCFFFFFSIIDLYFLIAEFITQIFNATAEILIPAGIANIDAKAEIETHPESVQNRTKRFVLFIYEFISIYFFN